MSTDQNKDVVRRFITEILAGGQIDRLDELVGPAYVNRAMGVDREGFRGMLKMLADALPERRFDIEDLLADGDGVVARFSGEMRTADGQSIPYRGLTYYRVAEGKVVEDDPFTSPELASMLGPLLPEPPT
jgi:predicted ester cyclase